MQGIGDRGRAVGIGHRCADGNRPAPAARIPSTTPPAGPAEDPAPWSAAPLSPTPDPDEPVVSVIMVRDQGTRRLPPGVLTVMWGGLFAVTCAQLHRRDRLAEALSTAEPGG